ncbi:MAG: ion transporter [Planctomycetota bacterium]
MPEDLRPWRERLHDVIFESDTPNGKAFDIALIIAILASVLVVILSTMVWAEAEPWHGRFIAVEWLFTIVFTVEYVTRLIVVKRPLKYALSFFGIIDLLAILPAFIGLVVPPTTEVERLLVIRTLRLLRIFRVLKLARYLSEATALRRAFILSRHKIIVFITMVLIVVLISASVMHVVESQAGNEAFNSMPSAMYWAIITMTTVGYGDITPVTAFGKFVTALLVLIGYSMIIVPTGILSAEIAQQQRRGAVSGQSCRNCLLEGHDADAAFCKRCGHTLGQVSEGG